MKDGEKKFNNSNIEKYAADEESRWGAKSKSKIWFGCKRHEAADMRYGLVKKVAVIPANAPDFKMAKSICPKQGAVFMDKIYDVKKIDALLKAKGVHVSMIKKNNKFKQKQKS